MSLKFLILDTYYPEFLDSFYAQNFDLACRPYAEQWRALMDQCFGTADFYSANLKKLGHEAYEVVANCEPLQRQWARENGLRLGLGRNWLRKVLAAQIETFKPDVLYVQNMNWADATFFRGVRPHVRLLVGQTAYGLLPGFNYGEYDLVLTSFPHYVNMFRNLGLPSEYLRLAFEPAILQRLGDTQPIYGAVFVGGYTGSHYRGNQLLERVAKRIPVDFWGYGAEFLPSNSPSRQKYRGQAWGLEMYRILAQSRIALNRHIDLAGRFANNLRLFEATGVGTCLVTDMKDNLHELFEPGKEVVVYHSAEECAELVQYYLDHEDERAAIARAGQQRTLREHTYYCRMQEMVDIVERYLRQPQRATRCVFITLPSRKQQYVSRVATVARPLLARLPLPVQGLLRLLYHRVRMPSAGQISSSYRVISALSITQKLVDGWKDPSIPGRQRQLVQTELSRMYQGDVVPVYQVAVEAVRTTGMIDGSIIEVGCASGYYYEVLRYLLGREINYIGIDYSPSLVAQAREFYPHVPFLVGDTTRLPLADRSCDILVSGTVLLHVPEYERAIRETSRVARYWCVFHRTPVVRTSPTIFLSKIAYGVKVVELVFNEKELLRLFAKYGLSVFGEFVVGSHRIEGIVREEVVMKTYICRKDAQGADG